MLFYLCVLHKLQVLKGWFKRSKPIVKLDYRLSNVTVKNLITPI